MKNKIKVLLMCVASMFMVSLTGCISPEEQLSKGYYVVTENIGGQDVIVEYLHISYDYRGSYYVVNDDLDGYERVFDFSYVEDGNIFVLNHHDDESEEVFNGIISEDKKTISIEGFGSDASGTTSYVKSDSRPDSLLNATGPEGPGPYVPPSGSSRTVADGYYAYNDTHNGLAFVGQYIKIENSNKLTVYRFMTGEKIYKEAGSCSITFANNQIVAGDDRNGNLFIEMWYDINEDCQGFSGFLYDFVKVNSEPSVTEEMENHDWTGYTL